MKLLQIMMRKKLVRRLAQGERHIYRASSLMEQVQGCLVSRLMATVFSGLALVLVRQTFGQHRFSIKEIEQLRQILDEMAQGKA